MRENQINYFAIQPKREQAIVFTDTEDRTGLKAPIVEKDFWVCWLLKQLFSIPELDGWLTFKGGTSLSKCFGLIQRFSEDVDLAVDYERLGFVGERNPRRPELSYTKRQALLDEMMEACRQYIAGPFVEILRPRIESILGPSGWSLEIKPDSPHIVLFSYPLAIGERLDYIAPAVALELGTHAEPIPHEDYPITPYAAEQFPDIFTEPTADITTVVPRRTFWEKATILHAEYHRPLDKPMLPRYSRHWADVAEMAAAPVKGKALADLDLLDNVCNHKDRFYHCGWANYLEAKPGSLHLLPHPDRMDTLHRDYQAMLPMFFTTPPAWSDILETLAALENEINTTS
ncbi:MAG: nucleotidyl transferase AbiEii/AbiGii toxin family protein [Phycisphaerae bacterium]|nr:nucleotidyl transferase AbiEii/AbiGii toxin family protein [Phycisphaerae bacterium]